MYRQTDRHTCRKGTERAASRGVGDGRSTPVQGQTRLPSLPLALIARSPPFPPPLLRPPHYSQTPLNHFHHFSPFASLSVFCLSFFPSLFIAPSSRPIPGPSSIYMTSSLFLFIPPPPPSFPIDVPFHRLSFCYSLQSSLVSHGCNGLSFCCIALIRSASTAVKRKQRACRDSETDDNEEVH